MLKQAQRLLYLKYNSVPLYIPSDLVVCMLMKFLDRPFEF